MSGTPREVKAIGHIYYCDCGCGRRLALLSEPDADGNAIVHIDREASMRRFGYEITVHIYGLPSDETIDSLTEKLLETALGHLGGLDVDASGKRVEMA